MMRWFYGALIAASVVSVASAGGDLTRAHGPGAVVYNKSTGMGAATAPGNSPIVDNSSIMPPAKSKIFSNFAKYAKGPYMCCTGFRVAGPNASGGKTWVAAPFTPATTTTVKTIKLALQWSSGTKAVTVTLNSDNSGLPGSVLHTFPSVTSFPTFPSCCSETTLTTTGVAVTAGQTYWVVVQTGATSNFSGFWNANEVDQVDNQTAAQNDGSWHGEIFRPGLVFGVFSQ